MGLLPDQFWQLTPVEYQHWSKSVENQDRRLWNVISTLMAFLYNRKRGKGRAALNPSAFNPYMQQLQDGAKQQLDEVTKKFKSLTFRPKKDQQ